MNKITFNSIENQCKENGLSFIYDKSNKIKYNIKAKYCCKEKCINYNSRCFCPPYSYKVQNKTKNKKFVMILVKTYDFSELSHFKNYPNDFNEEFLFKKRVFVRRWVQQSFYSIIKKILNLKDWIKNSQDIFLTGFSINKCNRCINKKTTLRDNCIQFPSPEAIGIDVQKTLSHYNYYIQFGVKERLTKVIIIFTDYKASSEKIVNISNLDNRFQKPYNISGRKLVNKLKASYPLIEFKFRNIKENPLHLYPKYKFLEYWQNTIFWNPIRKSKKIQKEIHNFVFMQNFPFALNYAIKDISPDYSKYSYIEFL